MARYLVEIPIAGHITVEVEADNEKDAIAAAWESDDLTLDNCENWEALESFTQGNVCYCPQPWEPTATEQDE